MKERPVMFSAPMVRAIIKNKKTMTRRTSDRWGKLRPGDLLWVKESFCGIGQHWHYAATSFLTAKWKAPLYMPRAASRITLEVTGLRAERLQDISNDDAIAEGVSTSEDLPAWVFFKDLWQSINGSAKGKTWYDNPWVWVISFRVVEVRR